jgi:hypothetical protein
VPKAEFLYLLLVFGKEEALYCFFGHIGTDILTVALLLLEGSSRLD